MRALAVLALLGALACGCGAAPLRGHPVDAERGPARVAVRLVHRPDVWPVATRLERVTVEIDGAPIATRTQESLASGETLAIFDGALAQGPHRLRVVIEYALAHQSVACHYGMPTSVRAELDREIVVERATDLCVRTGRESVLDDGLEALQPRLAAGDPRCTLDVR